MFCLTYVQGVSLHPTTAFCVLQETNPLSHEVKEKHSKSTFLNLGYGTRLAHTQEFPDPLQRLNNKPSVVLLNERGVTELMWALRNFKSPDSCRTCEHASVRPTSAPPCATQYAPSTPGSPQSFDSTVGNCTWSGCTTGTGQLSLQTVAVTPRVFVRLFECLFDRALRHRPAPPVPCTHLRLRCTRVLLRVFCP